MQSPDDIEGVGRHLEEGRARARSGKDAVRPQSDGLDRAEIRQATEFSYPA
jgi:hypothetical protein